MCTPLFRPQLQVPVTIGDRMMNGNVQRVLVWIALLSSGLSTYAMAQTPDPYDWTHWRGPSMDGHSTERNLPDSWSLEGENLMWRKEEFATRSSPIIMNGRLYVVCRAFPETTKEGERTVCIDAKSGEMLWESIHNVFLSDAPAERVGWSSVIGDPETDTVFVLGIGGVFQCLDGRTGAIRWQHSMTEEYGMLSTYGGRTNFPVVFEDQVIISGVMTGWGEYAVPAHRFVAFDKNTGAAVWITSTRLRPEDTTYSTPVLATLSGQAALVVGAGDGAIYAFQPRTGKVIWKYQASTRGLNTTPVVDENGIVYSGHSEQNANDTTSLGAIFAFDGNTEGDIPEDKLLWKVRKKAVGRSSPIKVDDRLYFVEDQAAMLIVDAKTGKSLGQKKLGRIMFGGLLAGDGKIFAGESTGKFYILKPSQSGVEVMSMVQLGEGEEIFGSPIIHRGRVYFGSIGALYCIGKPDVTPEMDPPRVVVKEKPVAEDTNIASIQLAPVELLLAPGQKAQYQVRAYNKRGQYLKQLTDVEVTLQGGGEFGKDQVFTAPNDLTSVLLTAKVGDMTSLARVRVVPKLPWRFDFNDGKVPPVWIGADYRHKPAEIDGEKALVKVSTIPKGMRSQSWMGWPHLHDYTVKADFYATEKAERIPDVGLINQRYTLDLQGAKRLQIRSWTPRLELRFAKTVDFDWQPKQWYSMKFQSQTHDGKVTLRGKVWRREDQEPDVWHIEATDETPNLMGSPGMYGNASDAEFYIDNVEVTENPK